MTRVKHVLEIAMVNKAAPKKRNVSKTTFKAKPKKSITFQPPSKQIEKKTWDVSIVGTATVANTWSVLQPINLVILGTNYFERIGKKILMKSMDVRHRQTFGVTRMVAVYDKAGNNGSATLPLFSDVMSGSTIEAQPNPINSDRFVILADELYNPNTTTIPVASRTFRKMNLETQYSATTGAITVGDVTHGVVYLMFITEAIGTFTFRSRIRYTDI